MQASGLSWPDWLYAVFHTICEILFQKLYVRHLPKRLSLPKLIGLTYIVTGATSGIGLETAKQLAEAGAHVVLACRNVSAAEALIKDWRKQTHVLLDIEVMELNLLSLSSVRSFAMAWEARKTPLHALINNAGICSMLAPQKFSEDGFEEHMQVNHLAPALLSLLLLPALLRSSSSRIINVNSSVQRFGAVDPNDLNLSSGKEKFNSFLAYAKSKLCQVYFSSILENKLPKGCNVHTTCVHPGVVATNVARTLPKYLQFTRQHVRLFFSPAEGARSVLFCATDNEALLHAEALRSQGWPLCPYYGSDCKPALLSDRARDMGTAARVWEKTLDFVGLPSNYVEVTTLSKLTSGSSIRTPTSNARAAN